MTKPIHTTVVIDGPAGAGKSTVARMVAARLGFMLLDTGAIYRALALAAQDAAVAWDDGPGLAELARQLPISFSLQDGQNRVLLGQRDVSAQIRTPEVSMGASRVSGVGQVRAALLDLQRGFAANGPVVAEGRDMGTVVFPAARVKVFLVADPEERARRRLRELQGRGEEATLEQVLQQQNERDRADTERAVAPLKPAPDAARLDTTGLEIDQVVDRILDLVRSAG